MPDDKTRIREFLAEHVPGVDIDDDEDIFAAGYVNSLFAVQLVMWVERTFDVPVGNEDLDIANFQTVSAIASFVDAKRAGAARTGETAATAGGVRH